MVHVLNLKTELPLIIEAVAKNTGKGLLCGYIYAKLVDLPVSQAVKAYAIWYFAETIVIASVNYLAIDSNKDYETRRKIEFIATVITTTVGVLALKNKGLMGNGMLLISVALRMIPFLR